MDDLPPAERRVSLTKLKLCLSSSIPTNKDRLAFLVLSGSFNPVHAQHMRALAVARAEFERLGWAVAGGFLAPSGDSFVKGKLGNGAWSLKMRIRLCELATRGSDWLSVCPWGEFSSHRVCVRLRQRVQNECASLLSGRSVIGVEVMGSDTAIRILDKVIAEWESTKVGAGKAWYQGRIVCCLVRPGPNSSEQAEHIRAKTAPRAAEIGVDVTLVDSTGGPHPLEQVSSNEIRDLVTRRDWDGLRARRWLLPQVLNALESWAQD